MRKLRTVKSEGSKAGIAAMSFGWRWGKKASWKIAPNKNAVVFCTSSTEQVSDCFEETKIGFFFYFFSFDMPAKGLEDFHEGLCSRWGWQASVKLAGGGAWQTLLLLPRTPLKPSSTRSALAASSSPSLGLVSSLPSPWAECEIEKILPGKQPRKRRRRTPTFFPAELNISGNVAKKKPQTQQTRGLTRMVCSKERILDPMKTARWNGVRGWEANWETCREGPPGWSGEKRKPVERQLCFHSRHECWGEVGEMSMNALGNKYPGRGGGKAVYLKRATHEEAGTQRSWGNFSRKLQGLTLGMLWLWGSLPPPEV